MGRRETWLSRAERLEEAPSRRRSRGVIAAQVLTDLTIDDAATGVDLIKTVDDDIVGVTADAATTRSRSTDTAGARGAAVVVPPTKTARVS